MLQYVFCLRGGADAAQACMPRHMPAAQQHGKSQPSLHERPKSSVTLNRLHSFAHTKLWMCMCTQPSLDDGSHEPVNGASWSVARAKDDNDPTSIVTHFNDMHIVATYHAVRAHTADVATCY